jgi:hypothetical protein
MSSDLVVLVLPSTGPMQALVGHLADWASTGVVSGFAVTTDRGAGTRLHESGWWVDGTGTRPVRLSTLVAEHNPDLVRVVLLTSSTRAVRGAVGVAGRTLVTDILEAVPSARVVRLNVVVAREAPPATAPLVLEGWHNVLLSPEHSTAPGAAREDLPGYFNPDDLARHATPSVAALAGLFTGIEVSPLDAQPPPPGHYLRTARTYFAVLDAGEVEQQLRREVISLDSGLPLPTVSPGSATYVENEVKAASDMAAAVMAKHETTLFARNRQQPTPVAAKEVSVLAALKMMFAFLAATLRGAPGEWWSGAVAGGKAAIAGSVSRVVFGEDSAYRAVISGQTRQDLPSTWRAQVKELQGMEAVLAEDSNEHEVHIDFAPFWVDVINGALTLCDGLERDPRLPSVRIGEMIGVVRAPELSVGSADQEFVERQGPLAARLGSPRIMPFDFLGASGLHSRLATFKDDPDFGPDANRDGSALRDWGTERNRSYGWQLSRRLGEAYTSRLEEIRRYIAILHAAADPDDEAPTSQRSLGRRLLTVLVVAVVLVLATVAVAVLGIIGWLIAGVLILVLILAWLGTSLGTFISHQRAVFQLLHRRRQAASQAQAAQVNLREAVKEARRLGDCYSLYLTWCRILGSFLEDPMATRSETLPSTRGIAGTLPLSVRFGVAEPEPMRVARVGHGLRSAAFAQGWLNPAWTACLTSALDDLGPRGVSLGGDPRSLLRLRAVDDDLLVAIADGLEAQGVPTGGSGGAWTRMVGEMADSPQSIGELVGTVLVAGRSVPFGTFRPVASTQATSTTHLSGVPFTPHGRNQDAHRLSDTWAREAKRGLGWVNVMVQFSTGADPSDFAPATSEPSSGTGWELDDEGITF